MCPTHGASPSLTSESWFGSSGGGLPGRLESKGSGRLLSSGTKAVSNAPDPVSLGVDISDPHSSSTTTCRRICPGICFDSCHTPPPLARRPQSTLPPLPPHQP